MVIVLVKVGEDWHLMVIQPSERRTTIHTMAAYPADMLVPFRAAVEFARAVLDMEEAFTTKKHPLKEPVPPRFASSMFMGWAARNLPTNAQKQPTEMNILDVMTGDVFYDIYQKRRGGGTDGGTYGGT
jgi:hypothetical protein